MMKALPEIHICNASCGHIPSHECWCEPVKIYTIKDDFGGSWRVIEHNDVTDTPHGLVLARREGRRDWITGLLESLRKD